jgi:hypothetical protein
MEEILVQRLNALCSRLDGWELLKVLEGVYERFRCQTVTSAALRIKGGSASPTVQTNAVSYYVVRGTLVKIASGTDWTALSGSVTNAMFNVFVFTVDTAGTKYVQMGTEGATLGAVQWPVIDSKRAIAGFLIINPTGTGGFTGGTTDLDDATVVPNAVFVNTVGAFDPTARTNLP